MSMPALTEPLSLAFTVPGEPTSKARARFTNYGSRSHAYTPERTKTAESRVALAFKGAGGRLEPDKEVSFAVDVTFINGTRQRRDIDNMLKLVLDGLNGVAWVDDMQVTEISARKEYVDERSEARTEVVITRNGYMNRLTKSCERCGKEFVTYRSIRDQQHFCSRSCHHEAAREPRAFTCERCGGEFFAGGPSAENRFCSKECARKVGRIEIACGVCGETFVQFQSWATQGRIYCSAACSDIHRKKVGRERRSRRLYGICAVCGSGTTRKEYTRCNPCKLAGKTTLPPALAP